MKPMIALVACLAFAPLTDAHASLGNAPRQDVSVLPADATAVPASGDSLAAPAQPSQPRRSRQVDAVPVDRKPIRLSMLYQASDTDKAPRDHCLQNTGSRVKREGARSTTCAGYGRAYIPDR